MTSPNEKCPCGSGKKYKRCCQPVLAPTPPAAAAPHDFDDFDEGPEPAPDVWLEEWLDLEPAEQRQRASAALENPEELSRQNCCEVVRGLQLGLATPDDRRWFAGFVRELWQRREDLWEEGAWFAPDLLENAILLGDRAHLLEVAGRVARAFGEAPSATEIAGEVLIAYGYPELFARMLRAAWAGAAPDSSLLCMGFRPAQTAPDTGVEAVLHVVEQFVERTGRWPARRELLQGDLAPFLRSKTGWNVVWDFVERMRADLEGSEPPRPDDVPALLRQFVGYLHRAERVALAQADCARKGLLDAHLVSRGGTKKGKKARLQVLFPVRALEEALAGTTPWQGALMLEMLPAWLRFLRERGLVTGEQAEAALEEWRPLLAECEGPEACLADWPRPAPLGRPHDREEDWQVELPPGPPLDPRPIDRSKPGALGEENLFAGLDLAHPDGMETALERLTEWMTERAIREEAAVRSAQGLGLSARQSLLLDHAPEVRLSSRPWFDYVRDLAPRLLLPFPLDPDEMLPAYSTDGVEDLVAVLETIAPALSLPHEARDPFRVLPDAMAQHLLLQHACLSLLDGPDEGEPATVPFELFLDRLTRCPEVVHERKLTLASLGSVVVLPDADAAALAKFVDREWGTRPDGLLLPSWVG